MKYTVFTIFLSLAAFVCAAQDASIRKKHFNLDNDLALAGYDAVAYVNQRKAIKGNKEFAANYEGVTYYFASAKNRDEFKKSPAKFEPAYGGWCAYAMGASGEKVNVDPKTFKIVNGELNLFYNRFFNNTLDDWNKDEA